jgi:adenine-specific DNA-methyltransferase
LRAGSALTPNPSPATRARGTQSSRTRASALTPNPSPATRVRGTQSSRTRASALTPNPSPASRARGTQSSRKRTSAQIPLPRPVAAVRKAARDNRRAATKSEGILWRALRNRRFAEYKFRRQRPVGPFILDFYCHETRLAIEIDGPIHAKQTAADRARQSALESLGIRFLRLSAELVETDLNAALNQIEAALSDLPSPAVRRGGGEGPGVRA